MARQKKPLAPKHLLRELLLRQTKLIQQHVYDLQANSTRSSLKIKV
jgi:hypothetical protein